MSRFALVRTTNFRLACESGRRRLSQGAGMPELVGRIGVSVVSVIRMQMSAGYAGDCPRAARVVWSRGANPPYGVKIAAIAQLVEHIIRNDGVGGSNPSCGTNYIKNLAEAPKPS